MLDMLFWGERFDFLWVSFFKNNFEFCLYLCSWIPLNFLKSCCYIDFSKGNLIAEISYAHRAGFSLMQHQSWINAYRKWPGYMHRKLFSQNAYIYLHCRCLDALYLSLRLLNWVVVRVTWCLCVYLYWISVPMKNYNGSFS